MELELKITGVQKRYNNKPALRDCSYGFVRGGVYALMGPNGSGKSTLLRICALLEPADEGDIVYSSGGVALAHDLTLRRRITLVLPRVGVFNATVFKNVAYGLAIRNNGKERITRQTEAALDAVDLLHKSTQNALTLSSGETQRLGIARAMAIEPELLFLDEPTASIDEENTGIVEKIILDLKRAGKSTVIMTTHDREQAERLADHLVLMRSGTIIDNR
jgi:ABC-type multidrug transport system ATPase subunit